MQRFPLFPVLCFVLFFTSSSVPAFSQPDTIRYGGELYGRIGAATLPDLSRINDPYEFSVLNESKLSESSVHVRAMRDFKKNYKESQAEVWSQGKHGYNVRFRKDFVLTTVRYTNAGRWIHTVKQYREDQLSKRIRALVKPVYYDYNMIVIYEITDPYISSPMYFVHMKDREKYKIVRVYADELEEVHSFNIQDNKR